MRKRRAPTPIRARGMHDTLRRLRLPRIGGLVLLALVGGAVVSAPVAGQETAGGDVVRIVARQLEDSRVEFALQQRQPDSTWGDPQLPRVRFFPTTAGENRWLASSPLDLPAGAVRIVARRLDDGRIEFALQQRDVDSTWGDRQLPRVRFFPTTAGENRWLASSPLTLSPPETTATPGGSAPSPPARRIRAGCAPMAPSNAGATTSGSRRRRRPGGSAL